MTWMFVTGNEHKHREAEAILGGKLDRASLDLPEIQAATTREVALVKARAAFASMRRPVIVEDAGFELVSLAGFPGPFIKYWEQLGGLASICRAVDGLGDRRAVAVCVLGLCDDTGARVVEGRISGAVAASPRGEQGFGWDAIFIPEGQERTFGEMTAAEKSSMSHRRRAWHALASEFSR